MATDIALVLANLTGFYDFRGKVVVHVGAGGGQFVAYAAVARHVIAVDPDAGAVARLRSAISDMDLGDRFIVRQEAFERITDRADVVLFEFCLHEIADRDPALRHARTLAPETVVIDHAPGSPWLHYTAEAEKVTASWAEVERAGVRRAEDFAGWQRFADIDALLQKVQPLGEPAVSRASGYPGTVPIEIQMTYRIALL